MRISKIVLLFWKVSNIFWLVKLFLLEISDIKYRSDLIFDIWYQTPSDLIENDEKHLQGEAFKRFSISGKSTFWMLLVLNWTKILVQFKTFF